MSAITTTAPVTDERAHRFFAVQDELTAPNGNAYEVRDIYEGHEGSTHLRLHGMNVRNTMYVPATRLLKCVRGEWSYHPTKHEA